MSSLLDEMPTKSFVSEASPQEGSLEIGGFDGINSNLDNVTGGLDSIPEPADTAAPQVEIPTSLSKDIVSNKVERPLKDARTFQADKMADDSINGAFPVELEEPSFDIQSPMGQISDSLVPAQAQTPEIKDGPNGFNSEQALSELRKLKEAGQATPMRLVGMFMQIFRGFTKTLTDKDTMLRLTVESLEEIYVGQIRKVTYNIPTAALEDVGTMVDEGFLDTYENLLTEFEDLGDEPGLNLIEQAQNDILPELLKVKRLVETLDNLASSSTDDLELAIQKALEFASSDTVFLQSFFDSLEAKITKILQEIKTPVTAIGDMAGQIGDYLDTATEKATEVTEKVTDKIKEGTEALTEFLDTVNTKVQEIETEINEFLDGTATDAVDTVVDTIKEGCAAVSDGVNLFFEQVNDLKQQLDDAVAGLQGQIDDKVNSVIEKLRDKIDMALDQITVVLKKPQVEQALDKAQEAVETLKGIMEDVSLKPVFNLVIDKTGDLEVKIEAIEVDKLGVPQKTALKVGSKIIQEVKIDEIIKPELQAIFKDIKDPIESLVNELKNGILQVTAIIDDFEPGTLATDLLENSAPYKTFISFLESIEPSKLLEPLKKANEKLVKIIEKLDPQIVINKLQELFDKLYELIELLSPEELNKKILSAKNFVRDELVKFRDFKIDKILDTIKEKVSIQKLLEGTGIQEITNAQIWDDLYYFLTGEFLDVISQTMADVEARISDEIKKLGFTTPVEDLDKMNEAVTNQIKMTSGLLSDKLDEMKNKLEPLSNRISDLDTRRKQLLQSRTDYPELEDIFKRIDLSVFTKAQESLDKLTVMSQSEKDTALKAFETVLKANQKKLKDLKKEGLDKAAPIIFKKQISDPVNALIAKIKVELQPFADTLTAIKELLDKILELPQKIDELVSNVLNTTRQSLIDVITSTIQSLDTIAEAVTDSIKALYDKITATVNRFNPYALLNTFSLSDFEEGTDKGLNAFRDKLLSPDGDTLITRLSSLLSSDQRNLLDNRSGDWQSIIVDLLNQVILQEGRNSTIEGMDTEAINHLNAQISALEDASEASELNKLYRLQSLLGQLQTVNRISNTQSQQIRLNRLIFEAFYSDDIKMSIQSLHPFVVEQIANLYPEATVQRLDDIYKSIVEGVKQLPQKLIQEPLDNKYKEVKDMFLEKFDIASIFAVLQVQLGNMDEELEEGLDRLSFSYNHLLQTMDSRLAE